MITFFISLILLILGYKYYGRFVEKTFGPDDRETPAVTKADGVDFMVLPSWKVFMIQFLNIAGTGPIFGAIMGMWYGPEAYLWIVFGCIFAGATHDYLSGMLCLRKGGIGLPGIIGEYLGEGTRKVVLVFSMTLLILVGAVFVLSPATLIASEMPQDSTFSSVLVWIICIFIYYILATMLPVDKIIGKIYPLFALSLIFMAIAIFCILTMKMPELPEIWNISEDSPARLGIKDIDPIFPGLFITIACGAISGFHATQSPMMARCMKSERLGRRIFYGSMITEGVVALIWATASSWFFHAEGWREICSPETIAALTGQTEKTVTQFFSAPLVVKEICDGWLGVVGGILAIFGVVAAPITSGDTALRSCRLVIADALHIDQRPIIKRLGVSLPIFVVTLAILVWQMGNPDSFNVIWKYFGWANQTLAVFTLWAITVYLSLKRSFFIITLIPAVFMTSVSISFIISSNIALGMPAYVGYFCGLTTAFASFILFFTWHSKKFRVKLKSDKKGNPINE